MKCYTLLFLQSGLAFWTLLKQGVKPHSQIYKKKLNKSHFHTASVLWQVNCRYAKCVKTLDISSWKVISYDKLPRVVH